MRKVVHFEIPADDLERAKDFYGSVFGWRLQTMPMGDGDYTVVTTTPVDEQTQEPTEP
jgi:predicted enzyme related to lactoylglutathione lyase